ncbi:hypothetical protein AVEN_155340-1 [Araneus ventricosus]|uniref:Uncharacterized protein n=1 Tax=Araneus ventricosus TaxID=182803 RepID=A0A4Y2I317_ARAVE|nr:hypothetical protein AVEN_251576-1 [Araneus ventricosus]GBM71991.1 hypothetical protein AVEN_16554-1 [Araneus ventricosus]GBM72027.1 hypothetical protein AVEN_64201-1 [Araneus ventricosus]GBM72068.1 hypothetical protein AVEN_155340-1 [Araneus ventricosus]
MKRLEAIVWDRPRDFEPRSPELAPPSPNIRTTTEAGRLTHARFNAHQTHNHGGSSVESGFEPGALRLQTRDLPFCVWIRSQRRESSVNFGPLVFDL